MTDLVKRKVEARLAYLDSLAWPTGRPWTDADLTRFIEASDRWDTLWQREYEAL